MERFENIGYSKLESLMLHDMYEAITEANTWHNIYDTDLINTFLQYRDHTDETYYWCLTQLGFLHKYGFNTMGLLRGVNVDWKTMQEMMRINTEFRCDIKTLLLTERNATIRGVLRTMLEE